MLERPPACLDEAQTSTLFSWQQSLSVLKSFPSSDGGQLRIFEILGAEDLGARALVVLMQYSLLILGIESRALLINIIAYSPRMLPLSKEHIFRELVVDSIALAAWRQAPGHHLPWRVTKGTCVHRGSKSAKLLRLLIYRSLRHAAVLLESVRLQNFAGIIPGPLLEAPPVRSLLWETYSQIPRAAPPTVLSCPGVHELMVDNVTRFICGVAQKIDAVQVAEPSEFTELLHLYTDTAGVAREAGEVQKRHLHKYAARCERLLGRMILFLQRPANPTDLALLRDVRDDVGRKVAGMLRPE